MFNNLDFQPFLGLTSPHLQILVANFAPSGSEPPSTTRLIPLGKGDQLGCELSTPVQWKPNQETVVLVHGLGGNHLSSYMIRLSRKFYELGKRVLRVNLRGCGSGIGLSRLPYNSGNSEDVQAVLQFLKNETPDSPINLIGFSLGGNIILKMAGELGEQCRELVNRMIAVCAPLDLAKTLERMLQPSNTFYHRYFVRLVTTQGKRWVKNHKISSLYEFDQKITAPLWGYQSPEDYYQKCSAGKVISNIQTPCDLLFAADDPIIDHRIAQDTTFSPSTHVWLSPAGSHMGFIGPAGKEHGFYWMDKILTDWVQRSWQKSDESNIHVA